MKNSKSKAYPRVQSIMLIAIMLIFSATSNFAQTWKEAIKIVSSNIEADNHLDKNVSILSNSSNEYISELVTNGVEPLVTLVPDVSTKVISTEEEKAVIEGKVTNDHGYAVTERGIVWSETETDPTIDNATKIVNGSGTEDYTCNITGLKPSTTYYVNAYAINSEGTGYGTVKTFTTKGKPTVTTTAISGKTASSAQSGGDVTADGGFTVTERGIVLSKTEKPTTDNATKVTATTAGTGVFTSDITGLEASTKYYVKAYATNSKGTAYGEEENFTTNTPSSANAATVTTDAVDNIKATSASLNGNITYLGKTNPTEHGFYWNTTGSPTKDDNITKEGAATATGTYSSNITGLDNCKTYYVKAYATNSEGTAYGIVVNFKTSDNTKPTITCIGTQTKQLSAGQTTYTVSGTEFDPASTNDNCGNVTVKNDFNNLTTLNGANIQIGTKTIVWTVTNGAGLTETCTFDIIVKAPVSTNIQILKQNGISIYPNPTSGKINFEFLNNNIQQIKIINLAGKTVINKIKIQPKETIDLSNLAKGIYIISIKTNKDILKTKIVKE